MFCSFALHCKLFLKDNWFYKLQFKKMKYFTFFWFFLKSRCCLVLLATPLGNTATPWFFLGVALAVFDFQGVAGDTWPYLWWCMSSSWYIIMEKIKEVGKFAYFFKKIDNFCWKFDFCPTIKVFEKKKVKKVMQYIFFRNRRLAVCSVL